jgi:hypothetical protein
MRWPSRGSSRGSLHRIPARSYAHARVIRANVVVHLMPRPRATDVEPGLEDDGWRTLADAAKMRTGAVELDHRARRRVIARRLCAAPLLVGDAACKHEHDAAHEAKERTSDPLAWHHRTLSCASRRRQAVDAWSVDRSERREHSRTFFDSADIHEEARVIALEEPLQRRSISAERIDRISILLLASPLNRAM